MLTLALLRHAKSSWKSPTLADQDRPLATRGVTDAPLMGKAMAARGPYAGCVGYFSANGEMDSCIVLRTSVVKDGTMYVQAGAGVVADSVPEREQAECVSKARALFKAAEEAVRFSARAKRGQ